MTERKALGRGLSSLIPTPQSPQSPQKSEAKPDLPPIAHAGEMATGYLSISPTDIVANPRQPRRVFSETALEELTDSIRRSGILQPLLVRKTDRGYELIAGERRLRAARRVGLDKVPVLVKGGSDQEQLELALIENLQREDLNPIEEAQGYDQLAREYHLTQDEIAKRVGKERSTVTNMLRLLKLNSSVQEMLSSGAISMGHARAILAIEDPRRQEEVALAVEKEGLSVRQVERLAAQMSKSKTPRRRTDEGQDVNQRHMVEELQRVLGTRVEFVRKGKGGEIRIQYYTNDDLKRLSDRLLAV